MINRLNKIAVCLLGMVSGLVQAGSVQVIPNSPADGSAFLVADYNVRYAPDPGHENSYLVTSYNSYGTVTVWAYDAVRNRSFYCYFTPASIRYESAVQIVSGMQPNGGKLVTERGPTSGSNLCGDTYYDIDSREQF